MDDQEELIRLLPRIGVWKAEMEPGLRGWVNKLGLYVQFSGAEIRSGGGAEYVIKAGGSFRNYFEAHATNMNSPDSLGLDREAHALFAGMATPEMWQLHKYDEKTWHERFSYLVWPTFEIAAYININRVHGEPEQFMAGHGERLAIATSALENQEIWPGLFNDQCPKCESPLPIWERLGQCSNCGEMLANE
ncbi:MAG: hypothetical protein HQ478_13230 [Chloroflexi bacterium]|nr:hypothetical protein [Chloroflexota bacterium]